MTHTHTKKHLPMSEILHLLQLMEDKGSKRPAEEKQVIGSTGQRTFFYMS